MKIWFTWQIWHSNIYSCAVMTLANERSVSEACYYTTQGTCGFWKLPVVDLQYGITVNKSTTSNESQRQPMPTSNSARVLSKEWAKLELTSCTNYCNEHYTQLKYWIILIVIRKQRAGDKVILPGIHSTRSVPGMILTNTGDITDISSDNLSTALKWISYIGTYQIINAHINARDES